MEGKLKSAKRDIAFRKPESPVQNVTIDRKAMHEIRDRAHKIYMKSLKPDAVLVMFQALKEYMEHKGTKANFSIPGEGDSK
jgi:hypothetical protein